MEKNALLVNRNILSSSLFTIFVSVHHIYVTWK